MSSTSAPLPRRSQRISKPSLKKKLNEEAAAPPAPAKRIRINFTNVPRVAASHKVTKIRVVSAWAKRVRRDPEVIAALIASGQLGASLPAAHRSELLEWYRAMSPRAASPANPPVQGEGPPAQGTAKTLPMRFTYDKAQGKWLFKRV